MTGNVSVDTGKLRTAAQDLSTVADRVCGVLTALEATAKLYEGNGVTTTRGNSSPTGRTGNPGT